MKMGDFIPNHFPLPKEGQLILIHIWSTKDPFPNYSFQLNEKVLQKKNAPCFISICTDLRPQAAQIPFPFQTVDALGDIPWTLNVITPSLLLYDKNKRLCHMQAGGEAWTMLNKIIKSEMKKK